MALALSLAACDRVDPPAPAASAHAGHEHRELAADEVSTLSIYQLEGAWQTADGASLPLSALRGSPVLALLFYARCESVCPLLVRDLQQVEALLGAASERVRFALFTFDPEHDSAARLAEYARARGLAAPRWTLWRGSPEQVRELAAAVGVRYRSAGEGKFSHTMRLVLLDANGVVVEHWDGLDRPVAPIADRANAIASEPRQ
jgi:protein SCO1/2